MISNYGLYRMFEMQKQLQEYLTGASLPDDRPDLVSYHALGLISELGEVLQTNKNWKPWNIEKPKLPVNMNELRNEMADCWLFLINLTMSLNINSDDILKAFADKYKEVAARHGLIWDEIKFKLYRLEGSSDANDSN